MLALSSLLIEAKLPCPIELVKCTSDKAEKIRVNATHLLSVHSRFEKGCLDPILRLYKKRDGVARSNLVTTLAVAGPKDKRVLRILKEGMESKLLQLNHNSHIAYFKIDKDLNKSVPYFLGRIADYGENPKTSKREREAQKIIALGCAYQLRHLSMSRTKELVTVLIKVTKDKNANQRSGSARTLGAIVRTVPKSKKELVKRGVPKLLQEMTGDKDPKVRRAASYALTHFKDG